MPDTDIDTVVASVGRLQTAAGLAGSAVEIHDALAEELLRLGLAEVHFQHLSHSGHPELAVAYDRTPARPRRPYRPVAQETDPGVAWVAETGRPLVAAQMGTLSAGLVGRQHVGAAALLPLSVEGHVVAVLVLVGAHPGALDPVRLRWASMLNCVAATSLSLLDARTAARTDTLTGLMNHGAMLARLAEEGERAHRWTTPLACVLIDLDDFKHINDRFGHLMGDGILRHAAEALRREFRRFDRVARYGGDEFVVILPGADGPSARVAAERARARLREIHIESGGGREALSASLGVSVWERSDTPQTLLDRADAVMLESKRGAKNRLAAVLGATAGR